MKKEKSDAIPGTLRGSKNRNGQRPVKIELWNADDGMIKTAMVTVNPTGEVFVDGWMRMGKDPDTFNKEREVNNCVTR